MGVEGSAGVQMGVLVLVVKSALDNHGQPLIDDQIIPFSPAMRAAIREL